LAAVKICVKTHVFEIFDPLISLAGAPFSSSWKPKVCGLTRASKIWVAEFSCGSEFGSNFYFRLFQD
jgi:hypothetical protein